MRLDLFYAFDGRNDTKAYEVAPSGRTEGKTFG